MSIFYMPSASAFGQNLRPSDGALLYFYDAGTTNAKTTYSDAAETVANAHPVVADSSGLFGLIYLSGTYKAVLKDKNEVQLWEEDNLTHPGGAFLYTGTFDSSTNGGNYPSSGDKGFSYKVSTGFTTAAASGSHLLYTGDFIVANKDGATGIDADWDIIRGGVELIDGIIDIPRNAPAGLLTVTTGVPSAVIWNDTGGNVDYRIEGDTDTNLFFLDASQDRIGIGTGTPDGIFHIHTGTAGAITASLNDLTVESNTNGGATFLTPDANFSGLYFGSPSDSAGAKISWKYDDDLMFIRTSKVGAELAFGSDNETETYRIDGEKLIFGATAALQAGTNSNFQMQGTGDSDSTLSIMRFSAAIDPPEIQFMKSGSASIGSLGILTDGEGLGKIEFFGDDGTDYRSSGAYISASVDGTPGANDMPGRLVFATTADGAASSTERMRITSAGLVGIGTDSPGKALEVEDNSTNGANGILIHNTRTGTGSRSSILFQDDGDVNLFELTALGTSYSGALGSAGDFVLNGLTAQDFIFITNTSEAMRIDSAGNVGIGTDSPQYLLNVSSSTSGHISLESTDATVVSGQTISLISTVGGEAGGRDIVGEIRVKADAAWDATNSKTRMEFNVTSTGLTQDTTAMVLDSTGNVGIGTDSPDGLLHVYRGDSTATADGGADDLVLEIGGSGGLSILTPDANYSNLYFGSASINTGAGFKWNHDADLFTIRTDKAGAEIQILSGDAVEAMRIDSSGNVGIGTDSPGVRFEVDAGLDAGSNDVIENLSRISVNSASDKSVYLSVQGRRSATASSRAIFLDAVDNDGATARNLVFQNNGGNVGIGTDSPESILHVYSGNAGVAPVGATYLTIEDDAVTGLNIIGPDASNQNIYLGSASDSAGAGITWNHDADLMNVGTFNTGGELALVTSNGGERVRIDSAGNVGIGVTAFGTNATNVLGIKADGTVPSSSPAGMVQIFADDSSGGATNATLAIRTEETVASEVLACDSTLNIWVNGTEYHLLMRAV